MRILFLLTAAVSLTAQVQGPQLGYAAYNGELRRIEGLSGSSRLSDSVLLSGYSRIDAGASGRWVLAATESETLLIDLTDSSSRVVQSSPFEKALWSPKGEAVVLDGTVVLSRFADKDVAREEVAGTVLAVSDKGTIAVRNDEQTAAAFDGDILLAAIDGRIARIDEGKSTSYVDSPVAVTMLVAGSNGVIYASNKSQLVRIDAAGVASVFDTPVEATRLDLLADGSVLIAGPALEEPGWLFRWRDGEGGAFFFVPGFPAARGREVVAQ